MPPYVTRASWYSQLPAFGWYDRGDRPGSNALGVPDPLQGIALPSRRMLGQWFNVTPPGGGLPYPMQQTDVGPAPWTGRGVDISAAAAQQMGYTPRNFPTDAQFTIEPRDEPRALGSPAGLPVQAGDMSEGGTGDAVAARGTASPTQGRQTMPSLWEMLGGSSTGYDVTGQPVSDLGFGGQLAQRQNSLIGLGLGLMAGSPQDPYSNALRGFAQGANTDASIAYRNALLKQHADELALRKAEAQRQASQWQQQFARTAPEAQPPPAREIFDPRIGQNVIQEWDWQTRQYKTPAAPTVGAPAATDAFTAGTGRPVYGQGGNYAAPAAPSAATGAQPAPLLPPQKPLSAHEQASIEKADEAINTNRQVIGNLQYAKQLSRKAASGPYALERGQLGSQLPGMFGEGGKETVMLHNVITSNAVEQLKSIFGGNPSEGERKILLEVGGSVNAPDSVRQDIYDRAIKAANDRLEENQRRAAGIRGRTYYQPSPAQQTPPASAGRSSADPLGIR